MPRTRRGQRSTVVLAAGKFERIVILVSTGRTGTKALAQHFNTCYAQVRALHEPPPSRHLRRASNRYLCRRLSREGLVRTLADSRRRLLEDIREPVYIESNPFLHGFLDAFDEVFENPRVVHIVRDPRTYVRSYLNFGVFRGVKGAAARWLPYWMIKPDQYETNPARRWAQMCPAERVAWRWRTVNSVLERGEALFGERYLRVRFEEVMARDGSGINDLAEWIGLPPSDRLAQELNREKVNASREMGVPPWPEWSEEQKSVVLAQCRELMKRYGYDPATDPR